MSFSKNIFVRGIYFWVICTAMFFVARMARGGAIDIPMQDSKAAGEADAFTAQADDPAAIFYNPAGITQLQGTNVSVGAYVLIPRFKFEGTSGQDETMNLPALLPHIYAETDLGLANWRFGIGVNNVDGINEDWGTNRPLSALVDSAQLSIINVAPTAAYQINQNLSVGASLNVYYGSILLDRSVTLAPSPAPVGNFHYRGDNFAVGATPGILWKINNQNSIGAYYRTSFSLNFRGNAAITDPGVANVGPSSADANLNLPQSIGIGYANKMIDNVTIEGDVIWTDWHSVKQLLFTSGDPTFNDQSLPASWKSGFTFRLGGQYQIVPHVNLRAGYAYGQNSVPTSTFSPLVPDSNYHLAAAGVGYDTDHWGLDVAYQFIYRETRHISGNVYSPIADGTWHNEFNGVMATLSLKI
ncbi:MAG: outer membrane protein transport protein [Tepidisphaeraceae bacterium]|jgi:long-chain fatty acid transport protein